MPRSTERGAMLVCFTGGGGRPPSPPPSAVYEEGSTSAASTSVGTGSPPSSASTSSPAFLDEMAPLYPDDVEAEADVCGLSTAIASRRFFLATPGLSNSIVDSSTHAAAPAAASFPHGSRSISTGRSSQQHSVAATAIAAADSKNLCVLRDNGYRRISLMTDAPRADFLKSMVEMAESEGLDPRRGADRARLHDLLISYIAFNDRDMFRDILGAFTELLCLLNGNTADTTPDAGAGAGAGVRREA